MSEVDSVMATEAVTAPVSNDNQRAPVAPVAPVTHSQDSNIQPLASESLGSWEWSDGVPGNGDHPDWFHPSTFKNVAAQAEGYSKLKSEFSKRLGGFVGAPDNGYEYALNEEMTERGMKFDGDNPFVKDFAQKCLDLNMSQDAFSDIMNLYNEANHAESGKSAEWLTSSFNEMMEAEEAKLGADEKAQFDSAVTRAENLPGVSQEGLDGLLSGIATAEDARAFMALIRNAGISSVPEQAHTGPQLSHSSLMKQLGDVQKMHGPARVQAQARLNEAYAKMFPGERVFGG